jgi:anti-anti-sigma factor
VSAAAWTAVPGIRYLSEMFGGVPVVTTPAEIDITTAEKLRVVLLEATSNGYPTVVVDMTRTRFCDCAGFHTLVRAHQRVLAEGSGPRLVIPAGGAVPQVVNVTTYYLRNQDVVDMADELLVFQVNASSGTQDTVDKARMKGIPVVVFTYRAPK